MLCSTAVMLRGTIYFLGLLLVIVSQAGLIEAQSSSYGDPAYCLLSRVDEFPCTPRSPRNTKMPNANEIGNYTTRVQAGSSGRPTCQIRRRGHQIQPIPTLGGDERLKFIFSPGIRLDPPENYGNQKYILYNISCPAGHLAFFNMTKIQLEPPNCLNQNQNRMVCPDYVRINRTGFGITEGCGATSNVDIQNQLELGEISILFRTSQSTRMSGFEATVICFKREDADQPGCTRPGQNDTEVTTSSPGRRRRDLDEFHRTWKRQLVRMRRRRRRQAEFSVRFENFNVPFGVRVFYDTGILSFMIEDGMMEFREPIDGIIFLSTFDSNSSALFFQGSAQNSIFRGPGPMSIVGAYAYFQLFAIDPRGIMPNPEEMVAIGNLTDAQYALVTEDNSTRLGEEELNPACADPLADLNVLPIPGVTPSPNCVQRQKRQADNVLLMLEDSAIRTAIENENACNPVLRTSARATINLVEKENPSHLAELREGST
ncbi:uncharacterized protein LOC135337282 [Halichondria panicea]|uniref:uncharacterized protein LOC135337282 n=1 Tax=Halichondria panicea TaxID=6063 RepID=UPI00312B4941